MSHALTPSVGTVVSIESQTDTRKLQRTGTQQELQHPEPVLRISAICPDCFYIPVCWSKCIELSCIWPPAWMHRFRLVVINVSWPHVPRKETCRDVVPRSESVKTEEWAFINKQAVVFISCLNKKKTKRNMEGTDTIALSYRDRRTERDRVRQGGRINFSSSLCCCIDCK